MRTVARELEREAATIDNLVLKLGETRERVAKSIESLQRRKLVERVGTSRGNRAIYRIATKTQPMPRPDFAAAWLFNPPLA